MHPSVPVLALLSKTKRRQDKQNPSEYNKCKAQITDVLFTSTLRSTPGMYSNDNDSKPTTTATNEKEKKRKAGTDNTPS